MILAGTHIYQDGAIFEYATGPDVKTDGMPLLQSSVELVRRFTDYPIALGQKVIVIEIGAGLEERLSRNDDRVDGMRKETILKYFPDGGELRG